MTVEYQNLIINDMRFVLVFTGPELIIVEKIVFSDESFIDFPFSSQFLVKGLAQSKNCLLLILLPNDLDSDVTFIQTSHEGLDVVCSNEAITESMKDHIKLALINMATFHFRGKEHQKLFKFVNQFEFHKEKEIKLEHLLLDHEGVSFISDKDFFPILFFVEYPGAYHPFKIEKLERSKKDLSGSFVCRLKSREIYEHLKAGAVLWFMTNANFYYMSDRAQEL